MWKSALALCCLFFAADPLHAQDRVALLIANSDYGEGQQLPEAMENVELLAQALEQSGFAVTVKENVEKDFRRELEAFVPTCPNGGVSLVYFCGYGSRFDRKLARTIEKPDGTKEKEWYTEPDSGIWSIAGRDPYRLEDITRIYRARSHARLNLLVLDCGYPCPKVREDQQGLMAFDLEQWPGGMVCYAAPPEKSLPAGTGLNLAKSLARHLVTEDKPLRDVMAAVQAEAKQEIWHGYALPKDATGHVVSSRRRNVATGKTPPSNPKPGDEWINGLGMVFCWCPPGKFRMGLADADSPHTRDAGQVDVEISGGFWICKYEVTLGDYSRATWQLLPSKPGNYPLLWISREGPMLVNPTSLPRWIFYGQGSQGEFISPVTSRKREWMNIGHGTVFLCLARLGRGSLMRRPSRRQ